MTSATLWDFRRRVHDAAQDVRTARAKGWGRQREAEGVQRLRLLAAEHPDRAAEVLHVLDDPDRRANLDWLKTTNTTESASWSLFQLDRCAIDPQCLVHTVTACPQLLADYVHFALSSSPEEESAPIGGLLAFLMDPTTDDMLLGQDVPLCRLLLWSSERLSLDRRSSLGTLFLRASLLHRKAIHEHEYAVLLSLSKCSPTLMAESLYLMQHQRRLLYTSSPYPALSYLACQGRVLSEHHLRAMISESGNGFTAYLACLDYMQGNCQTILDVRLRERVHAILRGGPPAPMFERMNIALEEVVTDEFLAVVQILEAESDQLLNLQPPTCLLECTFYVARRQSCRDKSPVPLLRFVKRHLGLFDRAWQFLKLVLPMTSTSSWMSADCFELLLEMVRQDENLITTRVVPYLREALGGAAMANQLLPLISRHLSDAVVYAKLVKDKFCMLTDLTAQLEVILRLVTDPKATQATLEGALAHVLNFTHFAHKNEEHVLSMCHLLSEFVALRVVSPVVLWDYRLFPWASSFSTSLQSSSTSLQPSSTSSQSSTSPYSHSSSKVVTASVFCLVLPTLKLIPVVDLGDVFDVDPAVKAILDELFHHYQAIFPASVFTAICLSAPMDIVKRTFYSQIPDLANFEDVVYEHRMLREQLIRALATYAAYQVDTMMPRALLLGTMERSAQTSSSAPSQAISVRRKTTAFDWFTAENVKTGRQGAIVFPTPLLSVPWELRDLLLDRAHIIYSAKCPDHLAVTQLSSASPSVDDILSFTVSAIVRSVMSRDIVKRTYPSDLVDSEVLLSAIRDLSMLVQQQRDRRLSEDVVAALGLSLTRLRASLPPDIVEPPSHDDISDRDFLDPTVSRHFQPSTFPKEGCSLDVDECLKLPSAMTSVPKLAQCIIKHVSENDGSGIRPHVDALLGKIPEAAFRQAKASVWIDAVYFALSQVDYYAPLSGPDKDQRAGGLGAIREPSYERLPREQYLVRTLLDQLILAQGDERRLGVAFAALAAMPRLPVVDWALLLPEHAVDRFDRRIVRDWFVKHLVMSYRVDDVERTQRRVSSSLMHLASQFLAKNFGEGCVVDDVTLDVLEIVLQACSPSRPPSLEFLLKPKFRDCTDWPRLVRLVPDKMTETMCRHLEDRCSSGAVSWRTMASVPLPSQQGTALHELVCRLAARPIDWLGLEHHLQAHRSADLEMESIIKHVLLGDHVALQAALLPLLTVLVKCDRRHVARQFLLQLALTDRHKERWIQSLVRLSSSDSHELNKLSLLFGRIYGE